MTESIPTTESIKALVAWASVQDLPDDERTAPKMAEARRRFDAWIEAVERAAAEKAVRGFVSRVSGSIEDYLSIATLDALGAEYIRAAAYRREDTE